MTNKIFVLIHAHEIGDCEDVKLIGVYSTEAGANAALARLRTRPGFEQTPEGFHVQAYDLDKDHWTEGFATVTQRKVKKKKRAAIRRAGSRAPR